jgi:hypothetical protein
MGYYTDYEISAQGEHADEAVRFLTEVCSGYLGWEDCSIQEVKWYSWESDLKKASLEYPKVLFILDGIGEESPDIWRAWALDGRVERVVASIVAQAPEWVPVSWSLDRKADRS